MTASVWRDVVGQADAVARLTDAARDPVHAYLLVGPRGVGARQVAQGFAALVLSLGLEPAAAERARRLAREGTHPDLVTIEAKGPALVKEEIEEIVRAAMRSPLEGSRKVILVPDLESLDTSGVGRLLKVVEEPPSSAVFVLLATEVRSELVTIASRCVTVELGPVPRELIRDTLVAEGADGERAMAAADAAGGDLDRARLLVTDERLDTRRRLWAALPERLDGTGASVVIAVREVRAALDEAQAPLEALHAQHLAELEARVELLGERGSGRTELVKRQRREIRRQREDELRFGLATVARRYHAELVAAPDPVVEQALAAIQWAADALVHNPNEALVLEALALDLPPR